MNCSIYGCSVLCWANCPVCGSVLLLHCSVLGELSHLWLLCSSSNELFSPRPQPLRPQTLLNGIAVWMTVDGAASSLPLRKEKLPLSCLFSFWTNALRNIKLLRATSRASMFFWWFEISLILKYFDLFDTCKDIWRSALVKSRRIFFSNYVWNSEHSTSVC